MKTTIDIPDETLANAIELTQASTKKEAILTAVDAYIRREKVEQLIARLKKKPLNLPGNDEIEAADVAEADQVFKAYHEIQ